MIRKRRNRVEHFFARINKYNFKFNGCDVRSENVPSYFNLLMHAISRSMRYTITETHKWNYSEDVLVRDSQELQELRRCTCKMVDTEGIAKKARDALLRELVTKYKRCDIICKRPQKSKAGTEMRYAPLTAAELQEKFDEKAEARGATWVAKKRARKAKAAAKKAQTVARKEKAQQLRKELLAVKKRLREAARANKTKSGKAKAKAEGPAAAPVPVAAAVPPRPTPTKVRIDPAKFHAAVRALCAQ